MKKLQFFPNFTSKTMENVRNHFAAFMAFKPKFFYDNKLFNTYKIY